MRRFSSILLFITVCLSANALALDAIDQTDDSFNAESSSVATPEIQPKSIDSIILETYNVYGSVGTIGTKTKIAGPISIATIRQLGKPLYEEAGYGLYAYQQYKAQVWYESDFASVIILMAYPNVGKNACSNCQ